MKSNSNELPISVPLSFSLFTLVKSHIIQLLNQNKVEKTNICTQNFVTACKYILK